MKKLSDIPMGAVYLESISPRRIARRITRAALKWEAFFPEHVDLDDVHPGCTNNIGAAFRMLIQEGIIKKTGRFRRSKKASSCARTVFEYELASEQKALRFLNK